METCSLPALDGIDVFIQAMEMAVSPGCAIFMHEFKGVAARVPAEATAFGVRREHVLIEILTVCSDCADPGEEHATGNGRAPPLLGSTRWGFRVDIPISSLPMIWIVQRRAMGAMPSG